MNDLSDGQQSAKEDYRTAAVMLRYNRRRIHHNLVLLAVYGATPSCATVVPPRLVVPAARPNKKITSVLL